MIVEDSGVIRQFLEYIIGGDPRLVVAASVGSAEEALQILSRISPDVISMDIRLPGMNGFEATQKIMMENPTPIVVVSASVESEDLKIDMNALRAGALAVVEKPVGMSHRDYELMAERLCTQLAIMSKVKVIRQRLNRASFPSPSLESRASLLPQAAFAIPRNFQMLGIVASTGGPQALQKVLSGLDSQFPLPIAVVQHMTASFLEGFASWLDSVCPLRVKVACDREPYLPGVVYVAPPDRHLCVERGTLRLDDAEMLSGQRPSGTTLFQSMARSLGPASFGVLLTGMGDDGAAGLKEMREAGGYTIAEDESTAVVYGMPAVAARIGAACEILPLHVIAPRMRELLTDSNAKHRGSGLPPKETLK